METVHYNYHCKDRDCPNFVQKVIIKKKEEFKDRPEECKGCGKDLYCIGQRIVYSVHNHRSSSIV